MSVVRYNPHSAAQRNQTDFSDPMFDDFFAPFAYMNETLAKNRDLDPKVDIFENDNKIFINAEMPGIAKEDINVEVKGKVLTLSGERKSEEEIDEKNLYRRECHYGSFERSFTLPFDVESEDVKGQFNNGILKLEIAKPKAETVQKITISGPEKKE